MTFNRLVTILTFVGLVLSAAGVARAAEKAEIRLADVGGVVVPMAPMSGHVPQAKRPAILPALYVTLGAMQAWDVYSTTAALNAGAREANPAAAPFAGNPGSLIGLKAATTAGTFFFVERMWKKNRVGSIVVLAAINGATAAVSMHNMRRARAAGR